MPFPDLQLVADVLKGPGFFLPNVAESTGTPDAGNNTFALPFVDAGMDPALIDPSRLQFEVELDPNRSAGVPLNPGVTDMRFVSLAADKRSVTVDFAQSGIGLARVTCTVNHTIEGIGSTSSPIIGISGLATVGGGGGSFSATLAALFATVLEIGAILLNPQFNASYVGVATSAALADDQGNGPVNVLGVPNPLTYPFAEQKNGINDAVVFTLAASDGVTPSNPQVTALWQPRVYFGVDANPALATEADIEGLTSSALAPNKGRTFVESPAGEYIYYAFPVAYPAAALDFQIGPFPGGFIQTVASVPVTANTPGAPAFPYQIWRSTNLLTGTGLNVVVQA